MSRLPLAVNCPNGCVEHAFSTYKSNVALIPILGKEAGDREPKIMAVKCPHCKFEAYASKEYQIKYGKPEIPYWDGQKIIRPLEEKANVESS